jgi:hypothetical protein
VGSGRSGVVRKGLLNTAPGRLRVGETDAPPGTDAPPPLLVQSEEPSPSRSAAPFATSTAPNGYLPYSNAQFHFSLSYPKDLQVQEYNEAGGGLTVTSQDILADQEFQVYVSAYSDSEITDARFKLDEPSGVKIDPTNVTVDGARGIEFFSNAPRLNDTREVWFIRGGFLYEVTTYKELDAWLQPILESWRFI